MKSFCVIKVPADDAIELSEEKIEYNDGNIVQCLTERLQDYYRLIGGSGDKELFKEQVCLCETGPFCCGVGLMSCALLQIREHLKNRPGMEKVEVTDAMVDQLQQMQTVDIITLLPPLVQNDYGKLFHALRYLLAWSIHAICSTAIQPATVISQKSHSFPQKWFACTWTTEARQKDSPATSARAI
jgi:hypothetical protein